MQFTLYIFGKEIVPLKKNISINNIDSNIDICQKYTSKHDGLILKRYLLVYDSVHIPNFTRLESAYT